MVKLHESDYSRIASLYDQGFSQAAIGEQFSVSGQAIGKILRKLKIETRVGGHQTTKSEAADKKCRARILYDAGASLSEIGGILKMSANGVSEILRSTGYSPRLECDCTPRKRSRIRPSVLHQLYKDGNTLKQIGLLVGLSREGVRQILEKLDDYQGWEDRYLKNAQAIESLASLNLSRFEIAEALGVSYGAVTQVALKKSISIKSENQRKDLTGQKFGRWEVVEVLGYKQADGTFAAHIQKTREFYWECRCECGRIKPVTAGNLMKGLSRSCLSCSAIHRQRKVSVGK